MSPVSNTRKFASCRLSDVSTESVPVRLSTGTA